jgi:hypothetical protein
MIKKIFLYLIVAGFLLAAQPAGAFDAGNWFTGRVAALDKAFAQAQKSACSSGRGNRSKALQQVMKHFKEQNHIKKQHSRH